MAADQQRRRRAISDDDFLFQRRMVEIGKAIYKLHVRISDLKRSRSLKELECEYAALERLNVELRLVNEYCQIRKRKQE